MPGPQVKNWDLYHKLRAKGHSKEDAARIANSVSKAAETIAKRKTNKTPAFPHGPSIKWPRVYEALRREGMDKSQAAAISNAHWNKYRRWGRAGAPGPRSAAEYERTRGRKARRRQGIPMPKSRQKPVE